MLLKATLVSMIFFLENVRSRQWQTVIGYTLLNLRGLKERMEKINYGVKE